ncbi:hypothetical protein [Rubritalea marina]|uniref:hypothetical protein n=1 Tax=Rubritalea marina TaxID=361055 RepID=UPI00036720B6|nr:hypothetical protein [Rubritalea marina]
MKHVFLPCSALSLLLLNACQSECNRCKISEGESKAQQEKLSTELTAEELLSALNGHFFDVVLPENRSEAIAVRTALIDSNGDVLSYYGGATVGTDTASVRVILFKEGEHIKETIQLESIRHEDTLSASKFQTEYVLPPHLGSISHPQGRSIKPGDGLIRMYQGEEAAFTIAGGKLAQEETLDLTVVITPFGTCPPSKGSHE